MNLDWIKAWLKNYVRREIRLRIILGFLAFISGLVILTITWAISDIISANIILRFNLGPPWWCHLIAALFILLLFWGNAKTSREYLSQYRFVSGTTSDNIVAFGANINPLAPETIGTFTKIIATILFIGPSLMVAAYRMYRRVGRLYRLDIQSCAKILALLDTTNKKMSYQSIIDSVPEIEASKVFTQFHEIDGVLFLEKEPAGLVLSEDLKADLRKLL